MSNINLDKEGYKHTPLGWIPEDWHLKELGDCSIIKGEYGINAASVPYTDRLPTYLRITDIDQDGNFNYPDRKSVDHEESSKFILEENDLVFARTGATVGKTYLHTGDNGHLVFAGFLIRFRTDKNILLPYYLKLFTLTKRYWDWVKVVSVRSGQPGINGKEYCQLTIPTPPVSYQLKITSILNAWDIAVRNCQQTIMQLKQRNKGLLQKIATGDFRLSGFNCDWDRVHIYELASEVSIRNRNDETLTVLSCTKYDGLVDSLEYFGRRIYSDDTSTYKIVPKNHFAYATNHIEEGSIGYQTKYLAALISPMYTVFKTTNRVNDEFFYKLLKSHAYIHQYKKRMEGSIDRRGGLRWDAFSKIPVYLPEYEEQVAINNILNTGNDEVKLHEQKLAVLQLQKKGLMQKLLTGEVRVKLN